MLQTLAHNMHIASANRFRIAFCSLVLSIQRGSRKPGAKGGCEFYFLHTSVLDFSKRLLLPIQDKGLR